MSCSDPRYPTSAIIGLCGISVIRRAIRRRGRSRVGCPVVCTEIAPLRAKILSPKDTGASTPFLKNLYTGVFQKASQGVVLKLKSEALSEPPQTHDLTVEIPLKTRIDPRVPILRHPHPKPNM